MSSTKLKKYLAYYRKVLAEDPENIEARLRLAVLFREMDRPSHAIEEYAVAAKLLASEGLPLEAIAACKAILELDSSHQETQFFLARLYARVPEATGNTVRVARPLDSNGRTAQEFHREDSSLRVQDLTRQEVERLRSGEDGAITLRRPKEPGIIEEEKTKAEAPRARQLVQESEEVTRHQSREEIEALHLQDGDAQAFEVGLFDLEELKIDETTRVGNWDALEILEEEKGLERNQEVPTGEHRSTNLRVKREFRISSLPSIPLFSRLPRTVFLEFLNAMELQTLQSGDIVLAPDDPATCLFVIVHGEVRVEKDLIDGRTVELARMGEGQVFGEFRLLTGNSGQARVVATTALEVLAVSDTLVFEIGRNHPEMWDVLWEFYFQRMLNHSMAGSRIFGGLSPEERELVAEHFERAHVGAGDYLFYRGDRVDEISLLVAGNVQVEVPTTKGIQVIEYLEEGSFLGVSPVALERPAGASVLAVTDLVVMNMAGPIFRELIQGLPEVGDAVRDLVRRRRSRTAELIDEVESYKLV